MFGKTFVRDLIERSAENDTDRRRFLRSAGVAGLGVVGATVLSGTGMSAANAADAPSDGAILNFALNLEYLEAEFYSFAVHGHGIPSSMTTGKGDHGTVKGGHQVDFSDRMVKSLATEIAIDEKDHVAFLRSALGSAAVAAPDIDLKGSFTAAARAAGLIKSDQTFDPFANENNFLLAAFLFEDVGVTAYKGAAPMIMNKAYLEAAAGILAVEAYHAGSVRYSLLTKNLGSASEKISAARDSLDGRSDDDQGARLNGNGNITPTDANGIVYSRSAPQVLNVVYLTPKAAKKGGFFPSGVNGTINTSGANS
jgi:Ferritin-like domain